MKEKKIVIAGGTGFIGKYLISRFASLGYKILIISRNKQHIQWDDTKALVESLEDAVMLINLAGKSVNCRYNKKNKREILLSRTVTTKKLGEAILQCISPPPIWINAGTATIYRHAEDRPMTEARGEIGKGFSVSVATSWEKVFFDFKLTKTRQVALRMAIVLGKNGGVIKPLSNLVRYGLGGKQGKGTQMFSWIHIQDLFNIIMFVLTHEKLAGIYNCAAPAPVDNRTLMKTLRKTMNKKVGLPAPEWLLKAGALMIGTETELILKSRWVVPEKLLKEGYHFTFPTIEPALKNILNEN